MLQTIEKNDHVFHIWILNKECESMEHKEYFGVDFEILASQNKDEE
jgi:hypothetical protein